MKELNQNYYLQNFQKLIGFVDDIYGDILNDDERDFLGDFENLDNDAKLLYVRLISRKGPYFRIDKLNYVEISSISASADTLNHHGFVSRNPPLELTEYLGLYTKQDLYTLFPTITSGKRSLKRDALDRLLSETEHSELVRTILTSQSDIITPQRMAVIESFRMLFFGNLYQNLSEFVITDLDIVKYEPYVLDRETRLFSSRTSLENALAYYKIAEEFLETREIGISTEDIKRLADSLPDPGGEYFLRRKRDRLLNEMARQLERQDDCPSAYEYYLLSSHPPARERRARILFAREDYESCESLLREISEDPSNDEELAFADFFMTKAGKKLGKPVSAPGKTCYEEITILCHREADVSVESSALNHFISEGYGGFYTENHLWNALFGLAFWDIIFAPLPGVFFNPFQRGPADLNSPDFYRRRKELFAERFETLHPGEKLKEIIHDRYHKSAGISNAFVNWKYVTWEMVLTALELVPAEHLLRVFERMSRDVRGNSSGFPDLFLIPPPDSDLPFLLAEVKGPGDKLQKNQKRWISVFNEIGLPFTLVHLKWQESENNQQKLSL